MVIQKLLIFIAGLFAGTFMNICIYRIPRKEPVFLNSLKCGKCGVKYRLPYILPLISYIIYRGKCSNCSERIQSSNPVVEILTGAVLVLLFQRYGWSIEFAAFTYLMILMVIVVFIDIRHRIIPNNIVLSGIAGGIAIFTYNLFAPFSYYGDKGWWQPLVGMVPGTAFLFIVMLAGLIIYKSDDVMGMGDIKIFAPIGMFLGWRMCFVALILSLVAGGIAGIVLIFLGLKKRKDTIPFGPFIALGTFLTIIFGWDIFFWYTGK